MLHVSVGLDRIICNVEPETSAEPYMWTSFFHADINTAVAGPGNRIVSNTPHANWTTRGVFPNGIGAGDSVEVPPSLGSYQVVLDPGTWDIALIGTLFALMEQDSTSGGAIRAGHQAFAEAVDAALNTYVDQHFPNIVEPTLAELEQLASDIQAEVAGAVYDAAHWYEYFTAHDDFYGFGYLILPFADLHALAADQGTRQFSSRIAGVIEIRNWHYQLDIPYDYQIEGHVSCEEDEEPPDTCRSQFTISRDAAAAVRRLDLEIFRMTSELRSAPLEARADLKRELRELVLTRRPAALELFGSAEDSYRLCRDEVYGTSVMYRRSKDQMRVARSDRLAKSVHGPIPAAATVVPPTLL